MLARFRPAPAMVVACAVVLMGMALLAGVARAAQPLGALTQLPGTAGCFTFDGASEDGAGTCAKARGIAEGESAAVSPDSANVYVGSYRDSGASLESGFAVFSRNSSTGALTQLPGKAGCLTPDGNSSAGAGTCTKARGLTTYAGDGRDVAFTSDGRWAYVAAQNDPAHGAVLIFRRNPATGALTQLAGAAGCLTTDGSSQDGAGTCQTDATLDGPSGISISSDDRFLYLPDYDFPNRIHVLSRNRTTGALAEVQCISEAPAPLGCSTGRVVGNSQSIALSRDGKHAYGGDFSHGLAVFNRNPSTGLLTQKAATAGCITDDGKDDTGATTCAVRRVVRGSYAILIARNGATLYDLAGGDHGFSVFHVNPDGSLTQLAGANGCVTLDGKDNTGASTCATGRALDRPYGGALSRDGRSLYVSDDAKPVGGVGIFSLHPATGIATQLPGLPGCISADGSSGGTPSVCTAGRALSRGYGMTVSPDDRSVYQATDDQSNAGLTVFARTPAVLTGLSVLPHLTSLAGRKVTGRCVKPTKHNRHAKHCRRPIKLRIGYTLNGATTVTLTLKRRASGRRVKGRCVKRTQKNKKHPRCTRVLSVAGAISRTGIAGANHFTWRGKIGGHTLGPGTYELTAAPLDGLPGKTTFKITR